MIAEAEIEAKIAEVYRIKYEELLHKIHSYYHEELVLRGDKNLNREYCEIKG
jgi:hypothetical protein